MSGMIPGAMSAYEAVTGRRSIRRFLATPVPEALIKAILNGAARAPSGVNAQPWRVHVVAGPARQRLSNMVRAAAHAGNTKLEYAYLSDPMDEPYLSRRRKLGHDLYTLYGIDRNDKAARERAMLRNFEFFGAPVGMFFIIESKMTMGSWLDMGMFMQNVMVMARAYGLETCPQQAWCDHGDIVHDQLGIAVDDIILSGMALGYADPTAVENRLVTERVSASDFTVLHID